MNTPPYWYNNLPIPGWSKLAEKVYAWGRDYHVRLTTPVLSPLFTICIGNVTAGGTGKTPIVRAMYELLRDQSPCVLMRGFGGSISDPTYVTYKHTATQVGDEAVMLTTTGIHVVVATKRLDGAQFVMDKKTARMIIMDDGLQNRSLAAQKNILVIDGAVGFGNGHLIPAGPLREPLIDMWPRVHLVIMVGDDRTNARKVIPAHIPIFTAQPQFDIAQLDRAAPYIAFAGIGRPEKFYASLRALNVNVILTRDFPDHYAYTTNDLDALIALARTHNAKLITTEKDMVKIPRDKRDAFCTLPLQMTIDNPEHLKAALLS